MTRLRIGKYKFFNVKNGITSARNMVYMFLKYMSDSMNVTNKMNDTQLIQASVMISTEYRQLTYADLLIWMKKYLKGELGEIIQPNGYSNGL